MSKTTSQLTFNPAKLARIKEARKILAFNQIDWTEHASATHFILHLLDDSEKDVAFWPTTGRFYSKSINYKGRGLNNLIEFIDKHFPIFEE
jgi:hypothetical protein